MHNEHCEIIPAAFAYRMEGAMLRTSFNPQNVRAISVPCAFFTLVEQLANVVRYGTHTQAVQCPVQHVGLYAGLMERLRPFAYGSVWFSPNNKFTCSNPPPLVSTRAKQPISIMAGATRVSWSTVGTYFPADCHMSRKTKLNLISLFMIFYV